MSSGTNRRHEVGRNCSLRIGDLSTLLVFNKRGGWCLRQRGCKTSFAAIATLNKAIPGGTAEGSALRVSVILYTPPIACYLRE